MGWFKLFSLRQHKQTKHRWQEKGLWKWIQRDLTTASGWKLTLRKPVNHNHICFTIFLYMTAFIAYIMNFYRLFFPGTGCRFCSGWHSTRVLPLQHKVQEVLTRVLSSLTLVICCHPGSFLLLPIPALFISSFRFFAFVLYVHTWIQSSEDCGKRWRK